MKRFIFAAMSILAVSTVVIAQAKKPVPRLADGHPDFNGYWKGMRNTVPVGNIAKDLPGLKLPLTPAGEAAWQNNVTKTIDPESLCIPGGIPRHNASGLPFEVLQTPKAIAFLYFYNYFRRIPISATRKHTDDPDPTFFGEELGHWDGDTLVIDSIGFKDEQVWADENGSPHSDALHVVERFTLLDADHINYEATLEDPKVYARPWKMSMIFYRHREKNFQLLEYECYSFDSEKYYPYPELNR